MLLRIAFVLLICLISGCASQNVSYKKINHNDFNDIFVTELDQKLNTAYKSWRGTPYKFGGVNKSGVDCSALVQNIFSSEFNIKLPRTTWLQVEKGSAVSQKNLRKGDLVFFKTGRTSRHVGVYIGGRNFINASSSKGVIVSSLDNVYWGKHYWTSRRILSEKDYVKLTFTGQYASN